MRYTDDYMPRRAILLPEFTPVVKWLIYANGLIFLLMMLSRGLTFFLINNFSLIPFSVTHDIHLWRLISYMFLHGGFLHLFFNMLMLWFFGSDLERFWGWKTFLKYYLITGIGGGIFHLVQPSSFTPVIGASGAIMGIMLAYGLKWPDRKVLIWFLFPVKMKWLILFLITLEFWGSINFNENSGIAHLAHLGGMVVGFIYLNLNKLHWWYKDILYRHKTDKKRAKFTVYDGQKDDLDDFFDDDDDTYTVH